MLFSQSVSSASMMRCCLGTISARARCIRALYRRTAACTQRRGVVATGSLSTSDACEGRIVPNERTDIRRRQKCVDRPHDLRAVMKTPVVQAVKGAELTQFRRHGERLAHGREAGTMNFRLADARASPCGKAVPPHVAGHVERVIVRPRGSGCGGTDEVTEEDRD